VFIQFKTLTDVVAKAFEAENVPTVVLAGSAKQEQKVLALMQKEKLAPGEPRVCLMNMSKESAAGANLTRANHIIFVHPFHAATQQLFTQGEKQAVGRVRRYGQLKPVFFYRFLVENTIDVDLHHRFVVESGGGHAARVATNRRLGGGARLLSPGPGGDDADGGGDGGGRGIGADEAWVSTRAAAVAAAAAAAAEPVQPMLTADDEPVVVPDAIPDGPDDGDDAVVDFGDEDGKEDGEEEEDDDGPTKKRARVD